MSPPLFDPEKASSSKSKSTDKPKRWCSPEQRAVNKRNASFSTGPCTHAGREVSKFNGLTHGMACKEPVVLPGEDGGLLQAKIDLWITDLDARTDAERNEVKNAVESQWRVDRCRDADTSAGTRTLNNFEEDYDDRLEVQVSTLIPQLPENPRLVVNQLENSTIGLDYLLGEFLVLTEEFASHGSFATDQRVHLIHLMRGRPSELFTDPIVLYIDRLNLAARYGPENVDGAQAAARLRNERPATMSVSEFENQLERVSQTLLSVEESRAQMKELLEREVARLKDRLELVKLREERDMALAWKEAAVDISPEGRLRLRYELSHLRAKDASLRQLRALQEARRKNEAAQPGTDPGPQPESESEPVPAGAEAASGGADEGAKDVARTEPKPPSSHEPAEGCVTSSGPVAGDAPALVAPAGDAAPAPTVEGSAAPSKPATAVNSEWVVVTPPSAGQTKAEGCRPDRTGTTQVPCLTESHAEGPAPPRVGRSGVADAARAAERPPADGGSPVADG
jgi:hypothetical protein